jgi:hypothetical protein
VARHSFNKTEKVRFARTRQSAREQIALSARIIRHYVFFFSIDFMSGDALVKVTGDFH